METLWTYICGNSTVAFYATLNRYDDQFVLAAFDSAPTADSEIYNKLDHSTRDAHESQVIHLVLRHAYMDVISQLQLSMLNLTRCILSQESYICASFFMK